MRELTLKKFIKHEKEFKGNPYTDDYFTELTEEYVKLNPNPNASKILEIVNNNKGKKVIDGGEVFKLKRAIVTLEDFYYELENDNSVIYSSCVGSLTYL